MKVCWSKIALLVTTISVVLSSLDPQAQAQSSETSSAEPACLGIRPIEGNPDLSNYTAYDGASKFWVSNTDDSSVLLETADGWKSMELRSMESFSPTQWDLREGVVTYSSGGVEQRIPIQGFGAGMPCDLSSSENESNPSLLIAISAFEAIAALIGQPEGGKDDPPTEVPAISFGAPAPPVTQDPKNIPDQANVPVVIEQPQIEKVKPRETTLAIPETSNSSTTPDLTNATKIPTPALLPGLIGMGIAALRKRKSEADQEA